MCCTSQTRILYKTYWKDVRAYIVIAVLCRHTHNDVNMGGSKGVSAGVSDPSGLRPPNIMRGGGVVVFVEVFVIYGSRLSGNEY